MTNVQADRLALLAKRSKRTIEDVTEIWGERAALDDTADVVLR